MTRTGDDVLPTVQQLASDSAQPEDGPALLCRGPVLHYQSSVGHGAGWSCGYECIRMLLSWARLRHHILSDPDDTNGTKDLQAAIEAAWHAGFDREGAAQLDGRLVDTKKWIGATEAYALLSFLGLNVEIVDVPRAPHSEASERILTFIAERFASGTPSKRYPNISLSDASPVMLQLPGHSVCIIGVTSGTRGKRQLIVLDPAARLTWRNKTLAKEASLKTFCLKERVLKDITEAQLVLIHSGRPTLTTAEQENRKVIIPSVLR